MEVGSILMWRLEVPEEGLITEEVGSQIATGGQLNLS